MARHRSEPAPRLGSLSAGRANNLNLIRMLAALAVLVSHAWPIARGPGTPEPLEAATGHSLGALAVFVFFAVSGFLIPASFARSGSVRAFLIARALRLMPGLAVALLLAGFVMGPLVTTRPAEAYLADPATWAAFGRNLTLVRPVYTLPGVFETNPYPAVQGSIWTLVHEVACYLGILICGAAGWLGRPRLMAALLAVYAGLWLLPELGLVELPGRAEKFRTLSFAFAAGTAAWLWQDRLPLSLPWAAAGLAAALALRDTGLGTPALILALAYATFWLAYVPRGRVSGYNRLGDYSYGTYLYAFPLQGLAVWLAGPQGPLVNIALALPLTLACAVLSWHLVEKPALRLTLRPDMAMGAPAGGRFALGKG
jgi:peptidoglycan/LPS O-acetylase OafA/YrhL